MASGSRRTTGDKFFLLLLTPLSWLYGTVLLIRSLFYRFGIFTTLRLPRPVISIGNITVGGTGKTPATALVARHLIASGYRVAVISRGYGGTLEGQCCVVSDGTNIMVQATACGDEPYLLASTVPGLMVIIGSDRYAAGMLAIEQLSPDIFLLDDGFQHLRLHRDLNILLLDYTNSYGNGLTLPGGLLREPLSALQRADLIVFTRTPGNAVAPQPVGTIPSCTARHAIVNLLPLDNHQPIPFSHCHGCTFLAFAGIADPESFFSSLRGAGLELIHTISFPDHADYTGENRKKIEDALGYYGADFLVTTEKDGVKLQDLPGELRERLLLTQLELTIGHPEVLHKLLQRVIAAIPHENARIQPP